MYSHCFIPYFLHCRFMLQLSIEQNFLSIYQFIESVTYNNPISALIMDSSSHQLFSFPFYPGIYVIHILEEDFPHLSQKFCFLFNVFKIWIQISHCCFDTGVTCLITNLINAICSTLQCVIAEEMT